VDDLALLVIKSTHSICSKFLFTLLTVHTTPIEFTITFELHVAQIKSY